MDRIEKRHAAEERANGTVGVLNVDDDDDDEDDRDDNDGDGETPSSSVDDLLTVSASEKPSALAIEPLRGAEDGDGDDEDAHTPEDDR